MAEDRAPSFGLSLLRGVLVVAGFCVVLSIVPIYAGTSLLYTETKGPFKNWIQPVDLEGDGDLDAIVSHTRWEDVDLSWAGVGRWVNQGDRTFVLLRGEEAARFVGFAAGAGDVDMDGDIDVFTQDFGIHLQVNQGGLQEGTPGEFKTSGGINSPQAYNEGYRDMGGTITLGDLNGDGLVDAIVAGCCYGQDAYQPGSDYAHASSVSWVWINDTRQMNIQTGHILPMDFLDGYPIRQAVLGDLDGDGDLDVFAAVGLPSMGTVESHDDLILLNDGTGQLTVYDHPLGSTDSTSVALEDINGDGRLDALIGTDSGAVLWINQGNEPEHGGPRFTPAFQSFEAEQTLGDRLARLFSSAVGRLFRLYLPYGSVRTRAVFLSDLDGDGDPDALLARLWGAEVWWNDGQGEFSRSDLHFSYREDTGLAVADFDGDREPDIFTGRNEYDYQVWWNDGQGGFTSTSR